MYETFYGFREKPFSLTPDPRFFYGSQCHANALELVQHGSRKPSGLTVITGTSGTGKTTTCRKILDAADRRTFTSLVLNPYVSGEDLLRLVLQDFGVISREEIRRGLLDGVRTIDLLRTLEDFLGSLNALGAQALLIVDEAQKLPIAGARTGQAADENCGRNAAARCPRGAARPDRQPASAGPALTRRARNHPLPLASADARRNDRVHPAQVERCR